MVDLYNRQAQSLTTHSPVAEPVDTSASEILTERAKDTAKIASENFVLGQKQVLSGVLDYGYKQAEDNPQQFLDLTNEAFQKQVDGLPEVMKEKMTKNFLTSQKNYLLKVENNFTKKQDEELKASSQATIDDAASQIQLANQNLYTALVSGREKDIVIAKQTIDNLTKQVMAQSELTTSDGSYIYDKKNRQKIQSGDIYDAQGDFEEAIDSMSLEKLQEWDKEVFQNQKKYTNQTGVSRKAYANQSKYIASRLKALGAEDARIIKSQADFVAAELIADFNPDKYDALVKQDIIDSDMLEAIKNVGEKPKSVNEVVNAYKLTDTMNKLMPIFANTDNSEIGNEQRFSAATKILKDYANFADATGLDIDEQQTFLDLMSKGLTDRNFSEALQPIYSDTALKESFNLRDIDEAMAGGYGADYTPPKAAKEEKPKATAPTYMQTMNILGMGIAGVITGNEPNLLSVPSAFYEKNMQRIADGYAKKNARQLANQYVENALIYAVAGEYDTAKQILAEGNREVIKTRNAPYVSKAEFDRLENNIKNNEKAYITIKSGTYEFLGYSNKDAIFKAVK